MANNNNQNQVVITFKAFNQQFNSAMSEMNKETAELKQQMKLQQEQMKHTATETEKLEAKMSGLQQIYEVTQRKTQETAAALQRAKAMWGENSEEAKKFEAQLRRNQIAEQQAANAITANTAALDRARQAQADQTQSMQTLNNLFSVTGQSVNDFADLLGRDLTRAIQNGTASANDLDRAFGRITRATQGADVSIADVRRSLSQLNGGNVDEIRADLERLRQEAEQAEQSVGGLSDELKSMAGAAVAVVGVGSVISEALSSASLDTKIDIAFNVPEESKSSVRQAIKDVEVYVDDVNEAAEGVRRQWALNKDASDEANAAIVKGAGSIAKAYEAIDFVELVQETNEIAGELKITDAEALNLVDSLLKIGFPPEQLDIISEYGNQLQRAGYEADEIKGIMAAAVKTDSWNIDNLLDGLKEGRITAAEMGRGLSESMKDAVRDAVGTTQKLSDDQLAVMESGFEKQENALAKSLEKRENAIAKNHDNQKKALSKALDAEYESTSKAYSKLEDEKSKSLEKQYDEVAKTLEKQQREQEKALDAELKALEKASNEKIALIDKEYTEKLKLIDEERYNQVKAIEAQIEGINAAQDAEDKRQQEKDNAQKRAELKEKIRTAKDSKSKQEAAQALRDFEEKLRLDKAKEARKAQIDDLKSEKDAVNEKFDEQKDAIKSELDEKKQQAKDIADAEKEALKERQSAEKEALKEINNEKLNALKESNSAEISAFKEVNAQKLKVLKDEHSARQDALNERLSAESSAVKAAHQAELDSFKAMNDQKMKLAADPPDSAAVQSVFSQLENWGKLIAQGGAEGSKAFEEMTRWLDETEDATLRNALGTELFKTKWEDQGENIIDTILGIKEALNDTDDAQKNTQNTMEGWNTDPATQMKQAFIDVKEALAPLLIVLAAVIGAIAKFASEHEILTSIIVGVAGAVGIVGGAVAALTPVIGGIMKIWPNLKVAITAVTTVFAGLSSTVLIVIGVIIGIVAAVVLVVKNWDWLKEKTIEVISAIGTFFKDNWKTMLAYLFGPVGILVKYIIENWEEIRTKTIAVFTKIGEFLSGILEKILKFIKETVGKIKQFFSFDDLLTSAKSKWDAIYNAIANPIDKARSAVKTAIDAIKGFFKFDFDWPKLKVPKFDIKGSLNPLDWFGEGLPKIDIQWFAKGGIMTSPTVFGRNGNSLMAGGEAGAEAVIPLNERVLSAIGNAIFAASGGGTGEQVIHQYNYQGMLDGAVFHVREEADIKKVSRELFVLQQQKNRGAGRE